MMRDNDARFDLIFNPYSSAITKQYLINQDKVYFEIWKYISP